MNSHQNTDSSKTKKLNNEEAFINNKIITHPDNSNINMIKASGKSDVSLINKKSTSNNYNLETNHQSTFNSILNLANKNISNNTVDQNISESQNSSFLLNNVNESEDTVAKTNNNITLNDKRNNDIKRKSIENIGSEVLRNENNKEKVLNTDTSNNILNEILKATNNLESYYLRMLKLRLLEMNLVTKSNSNALLLLNNQNSNKNFSDMTLINDLLQHLNSNSVNCVNMTSPNNFSTINNNTIYNNSNNNINTDYNYNDNKKKEEGFLSYIYKNNKNNIRSNSSYNSCQEDSYITIKPNNKEIMSPKHNTSVNNLNKRLENTVNRNNNIDNDLNLKEDDDNVLQYSNLANKYLESKANNSIYCSNNNNFSNVDKNHNRNLVTHKIASKSFNSNKDITNSYHSNKNDTYYHHDINVNSYRFIKNTSYRNSEVEIKCPICYNEIAKIDDKTNKVSNDYDKNVLPLIISSCFNNNYLSKNILIKVTKLLNYNRLEACVLLKFLEKIADGSIIKNESKEKEEEDKNTIITKNTKITEITKMTAKQIPLALAPGNTQDNNIILSALYIKNKLNNRGESTIEINKNLIKDNYFKTTLDFDTCLVDWKSKYDSLYSDLNSLISYDEVNSLYSDYNTLNGNCYEHADYNKIVDEIDKFNNLDHIEYQNLSKKNRKRYEYLSKIKNKSNKVILPSRKSKESNYINLNNNITNNINENTSKYNINKDTSDLALKDTNNTNNTNNANYNKNIKNNLINKSILFNVIHNNSLLSDNINSNNTKSNISNSKSLVYSKSNTNK